MWRVRRSHCQEPNQRIGYYTVQTQYHSEITDTRCNPGHGWLVTGPQRSKLLAKLHKEIRISNANTFTTLTDITSKREEYNLMDVQSEEEPLSGTEPESWLLDRSLRCKIRIININSYKPTEEGRHKWEDSQYLKGIDIGLWYGNRASESVVVKPPILAWKFSAKS